MFVAKLWVREMEIAILDLSYSTFFPFLFLHGFVGLFYS